MSMSVGARLKMIAKTVAVEDLASNRLTLKLNVLPHHESTDFVKSVPRHVPSCKRVVVANVDRNSSSFHLAKARAESFIEGYLLASGTRLKLVIAGIKIPNNIHPEEPDHAVALFFTEDVDELVDFVARTAVVLSVMES